MNDKSQQVSSPERLKLVVIGGGFGGLQLVRSLSREPLDITLIDRRNFHLFQPLLYQVATGGLSPANIASPLRSLVRRQKNCRVLLAEAEGFDLAAREVVLHEGRVPFDICIVAAGARHSYFGRDDWEALAPGLKTIEDATEIRGRILRAFEEAEQTTDPVRREALLTFVVVGAGPTGVELAGTLMEIARYTLRRDFRNIDPAGAQVLLVEAGDRALPAFDEELSRRAASQLARLGVVVRLKTRVSELTPGAVLVESTGGPETIVAETVVWAAGVQGASIGQRLAKAAGIDCDKSGRVPVNPDFSIEGARDIYVIGDLAACKLPDGSQLPGIAPAAMQAGQYLAQVVRARLRNEPAPAFRYRDRGMMATIGRAAAVARLGGWRFSGLPAWLIWLVVHLMFLVQFQNRLLVLVQWAWNYFTFNRSARLITNEVARHPPEAA
ncbi:MAG: NAD(P)/FAD-dependent oxidoreductase [Planctomyces sp.]|nr:NAD(P)/FAD-dependent oxidoreductase [Planctomyces sp.]